MIIEAKAEEGRKQWGRDEGRISHDLSKVFLEEEKSRFCETGTIYLSIISKIYIHILAVTTDGGGCEWLLCSFGLCVFSKLSAMRTYRFLIRRNPKGYF